MKTRIIILFLLILQCLGVPPTASFAVEKTTISRDTIEQVLTHYVRSRTANLGVEVTIRNIDYKDDLTLPLGKTDYEVIAPAQWEGWGSVNLALLIRVNDRLERNVPVKVEVEALREVVVATRSLDRGEVISLRDVALQKRDLSKLSGRICYTIDEAFGQRARLGIRANTPLRADYLEKVPLVKSGQLVTIILENKVLRLTSNGKVRSAGAEGDTVMVQNMASLKEIPARVVDANTVKVDF